jgi:hypothetical protein
MRPGPRAAAAAAAAARGRAAGCDTMMRCGRWVHRSRQTCTGHWVPGAAAYLPAIPAAPRLKKCFSYKFTVGIPSYCSSGHSIYYYRAPRPFFGQMDRRTVLFISELDSAGG